MTFLNIHKDTKLKHGFNPLKIHFLPHHPKMRALTEVLLACLLLCTAIGLAVLLYEDIKYGFSLPLVELGLSEATAFVTTIPWLGILAFWVSSFLSVMLLRKAVIILNYRRSLEGHTFIEKPLLIIFVVLVSAAALTQFTNVETRIASFKGFSYLRSFNSFALDYIVIGIVEKVEDGVVTVRDDGQTYEIKNSDPEIEEGDEVAVHLQKPKSDYGGGDNNEPIIIEKETPIVVEPIFDPPVPEPSPDPGPEEPSPIPDPTPDPVPNPDPAPIGATQVTVVAKGTTGEEVIELLIDDQKVASWTLTTSYVGYSYNSSSDVGDNAVKVKFINDGRASSGVDMNAWVDYITVDGDIFQTEASSTYSTGSWTTSNGCNPGNKSVEVLQCNGYFRYSLSGSGGEAPIIVENPPIVEEDPIADVMIADFEGASTFGFNSGVSDSAIEQLFGQSSANRASSNTFKQEYLSLVQSGGNTYLRHKYQPTGTGTAPVGHYTDIDKTTGDMYLEYDVYFEPGFDFSTSGGKLPGLASSRYGSSGGTSSTNEWSARLMFRSSGRLVLYAYDYYDDRSAYNSYGRDFDLKNSDGSSFKAQAGVNYTIRERIKINSSATSYDGSAQIWVNGVLKLNKNNIRWWGPNSPGKLKVGGFMYSSFYGGHSASYNPNKTVYARFDNFKIATSADKL